MSGSGNGTISSSGAIVRSSVNPDCDLLAAIALEQQPEREVYRQITGREFEGEYGIRLSLMRRGNKFEHNNHLNDAAALRKRVAEAFGFPDNDAEVVLVRDLDIEEPTNGGDVRTGNLRRYRKTKQIIGDAYQKKAGMPHLVIHPTLELPILRATDGSTLSHGSRYLNPDFMVLAPGAQIYLIGDEKSFIVRDDTVVDASKLDQVRRQIAAGTLAMRHEVLAIDPHAPLTSEGVLIFANPWGLSASRAVREDLSGEIAQIEKAIPQLQRVANKLAALRAQGYHQLATMAPHLPTSLRESCYGKCIMVSHCEKLKQNEPAALGRNVQRLLGHKSIDDIVALANRRQLLTGKEAALLTNIEQGASILGMDLDVFVATVA